MSTNKENKLAVLFDADNVPYSRVREMLDEVAKYGNPTIKRIYGDWTKPSVSGWKSVLLENAITPVQPHYTKCWYNAAEREIRAMVMGKKAYLFCQTDEACERAAMMYSFFGACKVKGKNPERWLTYVLDHIGTTKEEDLYKLLPEFWEDIN